MSTDLLAAPPSGADRLAERPSGSAAHPPERRVAIIGGGPSAMYLLEAFVALPRLGFSALPAEILVVEKRAEFGVGLPYDPDVVLPDHNLAANEQVSRIEKGRELRVRFHRAARELRRHGVAVSLLDGTAVVDLVPVPGGTFRLALSRGGVEEVAIAILATGHWEGRVPGTGEAPVCGPWPAAGVQAACAGKERIAVLGTSLTAADVAVSAALAHGRFVRAGTRLVFRPGGARAPRITLMSRTGALPRVAGYGVTAGFGVDDGRERFDHALTPASVARLRNAQGGFVRLQQVYRRFVRDAQLSGALLPGMPARRGPGEVRVRDDLARLAAALADDRGLARFRLDALRARESVRARVHLPWQALIWQKTNIFRDCYGLYPAEDRVLLDRYATVVLAHQRPLNLANAERLLALARAGVLELRRLGHDYRLEWSGPDRPVRVLGGAVDGHRGVEADVLVHATGQTADLAASDDPLVAALLRRGLVGPRLVPFLSERAGAAARSDPRAGRRVVQVEGRYRYDAGGIDVDPGTCEVRAPAGGGAGGGGRLFALGPLTMGLFPISDGLHALHWLVPRIAREVSLHLERQAQAAG